MSDNNGLVQVKLLRLGGETVEVSVSQGASVYDALDAGQIDRNSEIRLNGAVITGDATLESDSTLVITTRGAVKNG